jgi:hypothetical protein
MGEAKASSPIRASRDLGVRPRGPLVFRVAEREGRPANSRTPGTKASPKAA